MYALPTVGCRRRTLYFFQHSAAAVTLEFLSWLDVAFVFVDDRVRLIEADVAVKSYAFRVVAVYAPNSVGETHLFFRCSGLFFDDPRRVVLVGDWNEILDSKINKTGRDAQRLHRCESSLNNFTNRHDLFNRFRMDHPRREMSK